MKNLFEINESERSRILNMHITATKKNYLFESKKILNEGIPGLNNAIKVGFKQGFEEASLLELKKMLRQSNPGTTDIDDLFVKFEDEYLASVTKDDVIEKYFKNTTDDALEDFITILVKQNPSKFARYSADAVMGGEFSRAVRYAAERGESYSAEQLEKIKRQLESYINNLDETDPFTLEVKYTFENEYLKKIEDRIESKKSSSPNLPKTEIPSKIEEPISYTTSSGKVIKLTQKDVDNIVDDLISKVEQNLQTKWNDKVAMERYQSTMKYLEGVTPGDLLTKKMISNAEPTKLFYDIIHLSKLDPNLLPTDLKEKMIDLILSKLSKDEQTAINAIWNGVQRDEKYITQLPKIFSLPVVGETAQATTWAIRKIKKYPKLSALGAVAGSGIIGKIIFGGIGLAALYKLFDGNSKSTPSDFEDKGSSPVKSRPGGGKEVG